MATLLLQLVGPLQAYYCQLTCNTRFTDKQPTKAAVIGILGAAKGYKREQLNLNNSDYNYLKKLNSLKMGVRVDQEGTLMNDFQTVDFIKPTPVIGYRQYLCDAKFLVGLESDDTDFLHELEIALKHPKYQLYLGRRNCVPSAPIFLRVEDGDLEIALTSCELLTKKEKNLYRLILETEPNGNKGLVRDVPISFDPEHRCYGYRAIKEKYIAVSTHDEADSLSDLEDAE